MEITACPICGSTNIGIGTLGDGIISGLSSWKEVCRNCGYQGASLLFDSESDYKKFLEALSHQKKQTALRNQDADGENKEQESDEVSLKKTGKRNYLFELILSVVLSIVFFIILFGSRYLGVNNDMFSQDDFIIQLVFLFSSFGAVLIFFFLFIVMVEMIYRGIRNKRK
jgi:transcription elongation factor Elf1